MLNVNTSRPSSFALAAAALLLACTTVAAQDSAAPTKTRPAAAVEVAAVEKADAAAPRPADVREDSATPKEDAANIVGLEGQRIAFDLTASRLAAPERAAKGATKDPLFVSDKFEWQTGAEPQGDSQSQDSAPPPLTPKQKMRRAARNAFLNPVGYGTTIIGAAITEYTEDDLPHKTKGDRFADFATRFTIRFTTRATNTLLGGGVFPILFKQDPRYHPSTSKNFVKRAAYAASRVFVTRDDDGNLEPNVSRWAGSLASSAIANAYEQSTPGRDRIGTDATFRRFAASFTSGMLTNIIREFVKL